MSKKNNRKGKQVLSVTLLLLLCFSMICGLTGCAKAQPGLNDDRGTNYKYDFVAYLDAHIYGANGYGFLDIKPKDLSVSDFKSEDEYIAVKNALDTLSLYIDPDKPDQSSNLQANKTKGLKNGDIVTLSIKSDFDASKLGVNMNLEPYKFQVKDLPKPKKLDIFDNSSVDFVGLKDGTGDVYPIKINDGAVPNNLLDMIDYSAQADDDDELKAGKSIISVSATLHNKNNDDDDDEDDDSDDSRTQDLSDVSLATYLGMQGYVSATSGEKVVREIGTPLTFTSLVGQKLQPQLKKILQDDDSTFMFLGNIQQRKDIDDDDKYDYSVTYYSNDIDENDDEEKSAGYSCKVANVKMTDTKYAGASVLALTSSGSKATMQACSQGFDDYDVDYTFGNSSVSQSNNASPSPSPSETPNTTELQADDANE